MILRIKDNDYKLSTNMGVAYDIEFTKKKKIHELLSADPDIHGMLEIMYFGFKKENKDIKFDEFKDLILSDDNIGYVELQKEYIVFMNLLSSTEKTELEVREDVDKLFNMGVEEIKEELSKRKN